MAGRIPHPTRRSRPRGSRALVFAVLVALCAASLPVPTFADVSLASVTVASPLAYAGDSFHYNRVVDACGVCGGVGESCQGCDRVSNSPFVYDACGRCQDPAGQDAFTFNATCNDCTGDVHGPKIVDDCGVCRDPADPLFSRAGIPDYHLGGCVGCDGVPNSGNVLDACGVCAGLGCAPSDETKRSWCCDCAGVPFGPHIINFCCECVDRFAHWGALSGAKGPPENHSRAEFLWAKGRSILADADAAAAHLRSDIANRTAAGLGATFNRSETVYATYVDAIAHFDAGWEAISHPSSDDLSECYSDVYLTGNASNPRDICGVCGGDNSTCLGCVPNAPNQLGSPIPDGGLFSDDCGVCGGEQGFVDDCGVCFGGNETCVGCDGVPNSGKVMDGCDGSQDFRFLSFMGRLGEVGSGCSDPDEFRAACDAGEGGCCGCDGTPNSGHTLDGCGACFDQGDDNNTHLVNATCNGCDGVAHSGVVFDYCCSCGGDAGYDDACYHDLLYEGEFSETPFDPYTSSHALYFTEEGKRTIDECGECRGWGYNGSTCLGCDGVYGSGLVRDGCGVCGGDCSTCTAAETGLPHDCEPPGRGWTGMDRTCTFVRTSGPDGPDDAWVRWGAFPNGTDGNGQKLPANESWYRRVNRPGALPFEEDHIGECRMYLEPEPPPSPRERREWVVKVFGKEEGPYTLDELESGSIIVTDSTTGEEILSPLLPTTLVARMTTYYQQQTINYGITSQYESRVALWQERSADRIVSSPSAARVPNEVVVEGNATELWHDGEFMPMAIMPGMERIIYPYCTGSTWRGGEHRLHGKKLPGNYLGIITSENITDTTGLADQAWNPLDEYIFDVSTGWIDQRCTCSSEWQYQSEPIAPTCPRVWFPWSGWVDDGWFVSHNTYFDDPERYTLEPRRSWAGGGWRVSGGWWVQDYGGGGSSQYGSATSNIYNVYGDEGDYGFGAIEVPCAWTPRACSPSPPSRPRARTGHRVRARWWTGCYIRGSTSIGVTPRRGCRPPDGTRRGRCGASRGRTSTERGRASLYFSSTNRRRRAWTCTRCRGRSPRRCARGRIGRVEARAETDSRSSSATTRTTRRGGSRWARPVRDSGIRACGAASPWSSTRGTIHSMTSRTNGTWRCTPTAPSPTTRTTARVWGPPSTCPTLRTARSIAFACRSRQRRDGRLSPRPSSPATVRAPPLDSHTSRERIRGCFACSWTTWTSPR